MAVRMTIVAPRAVVAVPVPAITRGHYDTRPVYGRRAVIGRRIVCRRRIGDHRGGHSQGDPNGDTRPAFLWQHQCCCDESSHDYH